MAHAVHRLGGRQRAPLVPLCQPQLDQQVLAIITVMAPCTRMDKFGAELLLIDIVSRRGMPLLLVECAELLV